MGSREVNHKAANGTTWEKGANSESVSCKEQRVINSCSNLFRQIVTGMGTRDTGFDVVTCNRNYF